MSTILHEEYLTEAQCATLGIPGQDYLPLLSPKKIIDCRQIIDDRIPADGRDPESPLAYQVILTGELYGLNSQMATVFEHNGSFGSGPRFGMNQVRLHGHLGATPVELAFYGNVGEYVNGVTPGPVVVSGFWAKSKGQSAPVLYGTEYVPASKVGGLWVRYGGVVGRLRGALVEEAIWSAQRDGAWPGMIQRCSALVRERTGLPDDAIFACVDPAARPFPTLESLFTQLHAPDDPADSLLAKTYAGVMNVMGLHHEAVAAHRRPDSPRTAIAIPEALINAIMEELPEQLTDSQIDTVRALCQAISEPQPLNGLLNADVGAGKTLVFMVVLVALYRLGHPVAVIAPTTILAEQLHRNISSRFPRDAVELYNKRKIANPAAILVSTSGLTTALKKAGIDPVFMVFDEQHKLSSELREAFHDVGTNILDVSATPIPRTMARVLFGHAKSFSLAGQSHVQRNITSRIIDLAQPEDARLMQDLLKATVRSGTQRAAIVYASIKDGVVTDPDGNELTTMGIETAWANWEKARPGEAVMLTGKQTSTAQTKSLQAYRSGEASLLMGTTIIEAGIDIPDIRLMIVRDARMFGIAQLHQMRGRLARNGGDALFLMVVPDASKVVDTTLARLTALTKFNDGYRLAEDDMRLRGFGTLDAHDQSGNNTMMFPKLGMAFDKMVAVVDAMDAYLEHDKSLPATPNPSIDAPSDTPVTHEAAVPEEAAVTELSTDLAMDPETDPYEVDPCFI